jgi:hypothetical protein
MKIPLLPIPTPQKILTHLSLSRFKKQVPHGNHPHKRHLDWHRHPIQ